MAGPRSSKNVESWQYRALGPAVCVRCGVQCRTTLARVPRYSKSNVECVCGGRGGSIPLPGSRQGLSARERCVNTTAGRLQGAAVNRVWWNGTCVYWRTVVLFYNYNDMPHPEQCALMRTREANGAALKPTVLRFRSTVLRLGVHEWCRVADCLRGFWKTGRRT